MDLVDDERIRREDVTILKPAARDPGGHDDDVPGRRFGRRLALAVDHADAQRSRRARCLGDRTDRERLPGARAGHDAEAPARGELAQLVPCSRSSTVSRCRPNASSMVSHAARVGAMTIRRPVGGSAAMNAS